MLTSTHPLRVSCHAEDSTTGDATVSSSRRAPSGAGALTGGVAGGAATGAALGTTAIAFAPPLGVVALLTGVGVGSLTGHAAESGSRPFHYPETVRISMGCSADSSEQAGPKRLELGLTVVGLTMAQAQAAGLGGRTAVMVLSVAADGLAAASGLRSGDVLLAVNGHQLGDAADLEEEVLALPPNVPLVLSAWRDGSAVETTLTRSTLKEAH